jgi:Spy/CpxP family protein refolding chaperone
MLSKRLDLSSEQQSHIVQIVSDAKDKVKEPAKQIRDEFKETRDRIAEVLTDEQKQKLEKGKDALVGGLRNFADENRDDIRERLQGAGDEIRMHMALNKLSLSEDQREKLHEIEKSTHDEVRKLHESLEPKLKELREETNKKVRETLTDEQRSQLEKELTNMPHMMRGQGMRRGGGGDDGLDAGAGMRRGPDRPRGLHGGRGSNGNENRRPGEDAPPPPPPNDDDSNNL